MSLDGTLFPHLHETNRSCEERMDALISAMDDKRGVTEQMKPATNSAGSARETTSKPALRRLF